MAVQIVRNQLIDAVINVDKLDNGAVSYGKIASADIETSLTGGANKLASASAIKAYVDGQLPDTFSGGNGINIDTSGDPDVISVDLETTNPGLYFNAAKLDVKLKANSGLDTDASGLFVPIGNGIQYLSGAVALKVNTTNPSLEVGASGAEVKLDAGQSILSKTANGLKVADTSIGSGQLASNAVTTDKIQDGQVSAAKVNFATQLDALTTDGSTTAFDLSSAIHSNFAIIMVHRNGLMLEQTQGTPSGVDQFSLSLTGGAGGVAQVTFGAAPASSDSVTVFYIA